MGTGKGGVAWEGGQCRSTSSAVGLLEQSAHPTFCLAPAHLLLPSPSLIPPPTSLHFSVPIFATPHPLSPALPPPSQSPLYGGNVEAPSGFSNEPRPIYDGKIWINLPEQCTIIFQHML